MPKAASKGFAALKRKGDPLPQRKPLAEDILGKRDADGDEILKKKKQKEKIKAKEREKEHDEVEPELPERLVKKLSEQARKQQDEMEREMVGSDDDDGSDNQGVRPEFLQGKRRNHDDEDDEDDDDHGDLSEGEDIEVDTLDVDEREQALLDAFLPSTGARKLDLSKMIMDKLNEAKGITSVPTDSDIDPRVVHVYSQIGSWLSRYRSGKMPKAFKALPTLMQWEEILDFMKPETWTPAAVREATRIFSSGLKANAAQKFYKAVLLPAIQEDFRSNKKLNFHLYQALKQSLYKPAAFFKGIIFPMCEEPGSTTLAEASIISSIMAKVSIPVLHSSAALLKISELPYSGPVSIIMRTLIDKKYALPYRVIDAISNHFYGFINESREVPVLWHQCLLTFVQRYKADLTEEQVTQLRDVTHVKHHSLMTSEIRRELAAAPMYARQDRMRD